MALVDLSVLSFFFFKHRTAYEMRISDWSSDVCSSDLPGQTFVLARQQFDLALGGGALTAIRSAALAVLVLERVAVLGANPGAKGVRGADCGHDPHRHHPTHLHYLVSPLCRAFREAVLFRRHGAFFASFLSFLF